MKKILIVALLSLVLVSCQKDLPLNSELNPTEASSVSGAKIYTKAGDLKNQTSLDLLRVEKINGTVITDLNVSFYAYLTEPVQEDIVVTISISSDLEQAKKNLLAEKNLSLLNNDAFRLQTASVTIKAGKTKSETPFKVVKGDRFNEVINALGEESTAVIALSLSSQSKLNISRNFGSFYIPIYKPTPPVNNSSNTGDTDWNDPFASGDIWT